ncbi:hypothetical protein BG004_007444 [Podila humilis]|nr:hypothetical protein BG004_007444 [Podila humilis]
MESFQRQTRPPPRVMKASTIIDVLLKCRDYLKIEPKLTLPEINYWKKPEIVMLIHWITTPANYARLKVALSKPASGDNSGSSSSKGGGSGSKGSGGRGSSKGGSSQDGGVGITKDGGVGSSQDGGVGSSKDGGVGSCKDGGINGISGGGGGGVDSDGVKKNDIFQVIATYINETLSPTRPFDALGAKSRYYVVRAKYDKAVVDLLRAAALDEAEQEATMDRVLMYCPPFERLFAVFESGIPPRRLPTKAAPPAPPAPTAAAAAAAAPPAPEPPASSPPASASPASTPPASAPPVSAAPRPQTYNNIGKHSRDLEDEPNEFGKDQEDLSDKVANKDTSIRVGKRPKEDEGNVHGQLESDLMALINQTGALQERAIDAAMAREERLSERERDHGMKLLREETQFNALLTQRRNDLEEHYQRRLKELDLDYKQRAQELADRKQQLEAEHRTRFEDLLREKKLFSDQQRQFQVIRTDLEKLLATQLKEARSATTSPEPWENFPQRKNGPNAASNWTA